MCAFVYPLLINNATYNYTKPLPSDSTLVGTGPAFSVASHLGVHYTGTFRVLLVHRSARSDSTGICYLLHDNIKFMLNLKIIYKFHNNNNFVLGGFEMITFLLGYWYKSTIRWQCFTLLLLYIHFTINFYLRSVLLLRSHFHLLTCFLLFVVR